MPKLLVDVTVIHRDDNGKLKTLSAKRGVVDVDETTNIPLTAATSIIEMASKTQLALEKTHASPR